jgi:hypothetical protein
MSCREDVPGCIILALVIICAVMVGICSSHPFLHPSAPPVTPRLWRERYLTEESSTAGLDSLDLGSVEASTVEAGRELREVEGNALGSVDGAKRGSAGAAEARLLKGTVLLGVVAVGAEGLVGSGSLTVTVASPRLGKLLDSGGRMGLGGVVEVGRNGSGSKELDEGSSLSVDSSLSEGSSDREHGDGCSRLRLLVGLFGR